MPATAGAFLSANPSQAAPFTNSEFRFAQKMGDVSGGIEPLYDPLLKQNAERIVDAFQPMKQFRQGRGFDLARHGRSPHCLFSVVVFVTVDTAWANSRHEIDRRIG